MNPDPSTATANRVLVSSSMRSTAMCLPSDDQCGTATVDKPKQGPGFHGTSAVAVDVRVGFAQQGIDFSL